MSSVSHFHRRQLLSRVALNIAGTFLIPGSKDSYYTAWTNLHRDFFAARITASIDVSPIKPWPFSQACSTPFDMALVDGGVLLKL